MSFQDQSNSLLARLHLSDLPRSAAFGIAALALAVVGVGVVAVGPLFNPSDFEVTTQPVVEEAPASDENIDQAGLPATGAPDEEPAAASATAAPGGPPPEDTALPEASLLCVHVDGAVKSPGVFYLEAGSRIIDAIDAAGGFTKKASTAAVNLAQSLEDGQQVFIPTQDEAVPPAPSAPPSGGSAGGSSSGSGSSSSSSGLVNINQASAEELVTLSGIGEATAAKIIADREANGPFQTIEDIKRVSGIGDKKFEALRDFICV